MSGANGQGTAGPSTGGTAVVTASGAPANVLLRNIDAAITLYWGVKVGVTVATGMPLLPNESVGIPLGTGAVLCVVAASSAAYAWASMPDNI